jgi:hypothetical protein
LPLPSPKVMLSLEYKRYYEQLRLPCQPGETSFPYIHQLLLLIGAIEPFRDRRNGASI